MNTIYIYIIGIIVVLISLVIGSYFLFKKSDTTDSEFDKLLKVLNIKQTGSENIEKFADSNCDNFVLTKLQDILDNKWCFLNAFAKYNFGLNLEELSDNDKNMIKTNLNSIDMNNLSNITSLNKPFFLIKMQSLNLLNNLDDDNKLKLFTAALILFAMRFRAVANNPDNSIFVKDGDIIKFNIAGNNLNNCIDILTNRSEIQYDKCYTIDLNGMKDYTIGFLGPIKNLPKDFVNIIYNDYKDLYVKYLTNLFMNIDFSSDLIAKFNDLSTKDIYMNIQDKQMQALIKSFYL